eukprot:7789969-Prorocentrum_lima.AAC.1
MGSEFIVWDMSTTVPADEKAPTCGSYALANRRALFSPKTGVVSPLSWFPPSIPAGKRTKI